MTLPVLHLSYNPKGTLKMNPTIGETGAMLILWRKNIPEVITEKAD
jgi:hypothetical protein